MANFKERIDLLKIKGSKLVTIADVEYVAIPVEESDIYKCINRANKPCAFISMIVSETSDKYRQICKDNHTNDENYIAPSHTVSLSLQKEHNEQLVAQYTDWFRSKGLSEEEVSKQVKDTMNKRNSLGTITPMVAPAPTGQPVQATNVETVPEDEDLPF